MQVHQVSSGRVITLDEGDGQGTGEQFVLAPQGTDSMFYATRVQTVTVFEKLGVQRPYFTVAGRQIHSPEGPVESFWEMPVRFHDAGVLPPHVRGAVEGIVPVADNRSGREQQLVEGRTGFEFAPTEMQESVVAEVRQQETFRRANQEAWSSDRVPSTGRQGDTPGPLADVGSSKPWAQRLADRRGRLAAESQLPSATLADASLAARNVRADLAGLSVEQVSGVQGMGRRLGDGPRVSAPGSQVVHAIESDRKFPPPSAFLNASQVREGWSK